MAAAEELVLSAWQIYTALFVMFWAAQLYLSSFWMSVVCCIKVTIHFTDLNEKEGNSLLVWVDISIVDGLHVQERTLQKYRQHTQGVFRVVVQNRYRVLTFSEERQEDVDTLLGLAKQEASLVPSLTAMAKEEANQGNFPHMNITNPVTEEAELASFNERSVAHERHGFKPSNL